MLTASQERIIFIVSENRNRSWLTNSARIAVHLIEGGRKVKK